MFNSDKVIDLIIQASIAKNCKDTIENAEDKSEAWSKASVVLSNKENYNDDNNTKTYKDK